MCECRSNEVCRAYIHCRVMLLVGSKAYGCWVRLVDCGTAPWLRRPADADADASYTSGLYELHDLHDFYVCLSGGPLVVGHGCVKSS